VAPVALGLGLELAADSTADGCGLLLAGATLGWLIGGTPHAASASSTPMSAPERRLIDRHGTWGLLGCTRVGPFCELAR